MLPVLALILAAVAWAVWPMKRQQPPGGGDKPALPAIVVNPAPAQPTGEASGTGAEAGEPATKAMVGRFRIVRPGAAGARPVLVASPAVLTGVPEGIIFGPHFGTIARLVMEQAVLSAARDDLGMATRVEALGDAPPEGSPEWFVKVVTPYQAGEQVRFTIRRGGEKGDVVAETKLPLSASDPRAYPQFVAMAESYAWGPFVEALKKAGIKGHPPVVRKSAAVETWLDSLAIPAQFAAVRALHGSVRADGESPERFGALVRGYANLGTRTEYQWMASHKLFKAHALLYAQRLAARDPCSPSPLWHCRACTARRWPTSPPPRS